MTTIWLVIIIQIRKYNTRIYIRNDIIMNRNWKLCLCIWSKPLHEKEHNIIHLLLQFARWNGRTCQGSNKKKSNQNNDNVLVSRLIYDLKFKIVFFIIQIFFSFFYSHSFFFITGEFENWIIQFSRFSIQHFVVHTKHIWLWQFKEKFIEFKIRKSNFSRFQGSFLLYWKWVFLDIWNCNKSFWQIFDDKQTSTTWRQNYLLT